MSEDKKVIINCDHFGVGVVGRVIICSPTNIICTVQAGGQVCMHPEVEGFPMDVRVWEEESFNKALNEFDDCWWGCNLSTIDGSKCFDNYSKAIDKFLANNIFGETIDGMTFEFDRERIKELMEGWWPVLVRFKNEEFYRVKEEPLYDTKFKAYLYFGNCD